MAYNNFGFAGLGMVSSLYSSQGLLYANMMGLVYRLTNMPLGIWIMGAGEKGFLRLPVGHGEDPAGGGPAGDGSRWPCWGCPCPR